jgi:hypothetical protein
VKGFLHAYSKTALSLYPDFCRAHTCKRQKRNVLTFKFVINLNLWKLESSASIDGGWQARFRSDVFAQCGPLSHATSDARNSFVLLNIKY